METVIFILVCLLVSGVLLRSAIKRLYNASKHGKCECGGACSCSCGRETGGKHHDCCCSGKGKH